MDALEIQETGIVWRFGSDGQGSSYIATLHED